jgi:hypothetical protein
MFALLYGLLVVVGLWHLLADANLLYVLGALTAACLAILALAIIASLLQRGIGALFRRRSELPLG